MEKCFDFEKSCGMERIVKAVNNSIPVLRECGRGDQEEDPR